MNWVYLIVAIVAEVIGTTALKAADGFTKPIPSVIVVLAYATAFYFLSLTLKTMPVGLIYAIWSGVGVVLICLVAWLLFGQTLDLPAMIGIGMIVGGVVVINMFSSASPH